MSGLVESSFLQLAWNALKEAPTSLERVRAGGDPPFRSNLAVAAMASDAIATASLAAALWADSTHPRKDGCSRRVTIDGARVHTAFTSERHFRVNGTPPAIWAPPSGFWEAADGWVRTHANYPHHHERLLQALELPGNTEPHDLARRLSALPAHHIEELAYADGGIAVAVRTPDEWLDTRRGAAPPPLVTKQSIGAGTVRFATGKQTSPEAPLAGLRVLDLTRVIAGPVCTRTLAFLGADVLRIDSPRISEAPWQHLDTGPGKTTALLDLHASGDRRILQNLLRAAHVVVTAYRADTLEKFGLSHEELSASRPGLIVGQLSAWGASLPEPWPARRGFDSIVQAATGIAVLESPDGTRPGALPAQALDHSAGYLLAAGILSALRHQRDAGGSWLVTTSLCALSENLLVGPSSPKPDTRSEQEALENPAITSLGSLTIAVPAVLYDDGPTNWPGPSHPWGEDAPAWRT